MADLASLKVADDLKILVKILYIDDAPVPVKVLCDREEVWLSRQAIEAAEHLPAPRVFKRGDWVKWNHGKADCIHRHCLFIKVVLTEPALVVIDDNGQTFTVAVEQLSHDEAPE